MASAPSKHRNPDQPHDVYIASDEQGRVIYVRLSWNAFERIHSHRYRSPWGRAWARIELRSFPTRHEAEQFERALIAVHDPEFNKNNHDSGLRLFARTVDGLNAIMDCYVLWRRAAYGPDPANPAWPDRPPTLEEIKRLSHFNDMEARHGFAAAR